MKGLGFCMSEIPSGFLIVVYIGRVHKNSIVTMLDANSVSFSYDAPQILHIVLHMNEKVVRGLAFRCVFCMSGKALK